MIRISLIEDPVKAARRERRRASRCAWKAANPEKVRATSRAWYVANREKVRIDGRVYKKANPEKIRERNRAWNTANPAKRLAANWRFLGIQFTLDEYQALLAAQAGICAICAKPPTDRNLAVDHCHTTGMIRGLLCIPCNTGLGKLGDSVEGLERALAYLRRAEEKANIDAARERVLALEPNRQVLLALAKR